MGIKQKPIGPFFIGWFSSMEQKRLEELYPCLNSYCSQDHQNPTHLRSLCSRYYYALPGSTAFRTPALTKEIKLNNLINIKSCRSIPFSAMQQKPIGWKPKLKTSPPVRCAS
jgi:hypothetical protein